jgi:hypothetical protein
MAAKEVRDYLDSLAQANQSLTAIGATQKAARQSQARQKALAGLPATMKQLWPNLPPAISDSLTQNALSDDSYADKLFQMIGQKALPDSSKTGITPEGAAAVLSASAGKPIGTNHPDVQAVMAQPSSIREPFLNTLKGAYADNVRNQNYQTSEAARESKQDQAVKQQQYGKGFEGLTGVLTKATQPNVDIDDQIDQARGLLAKGSAQADPAVQNVIARTIGGDKGRLAVQELSRWLPHTAIGDITNWENYLTSNGTISKLTDEQKTGWSGILDMAQDFNNRAKNAKATNVLGTFAAGHSTTGALNDDGTLEPGLKSLADNYNVTYDPTTKKMTSNPVPTTLDAENSQKFKDATALIQKLPLKAQTAAMTQLNSIAASGTIPDDFVDHVKTTVQSIKDKMVASGTKVAPGTTTQDSGDSNGLTPTAATVGTPPSTTSTVAPANASTPANSVDPLSAGLQDTFLNPPASSSDSTAAMPANLMNSNAPEEDEEDE